MPRQMGAQSDYIKNYPSGKYKAMLSILVEIYINKYCQYICIYILKESCSRLRRTDMLTNFK